MATAATAEEHADIQVQEESEPFPMNCIRHIKDLTGSANRIAPARVKRGTMEFKRIRSTDWYERVK